MLDIAIKEDELYHSGLNKFITVPSCVITLEHSLISIAKWESKWHIPYLSDKPRTKEQELDYIRCMTINTVKDDYVYTILSAHDFKKIEEYINNPMTASTIFSKTQNNRGKKDTITAESLYCRMFANNIPMECQKWHLNRLLALIRACELKNSPPQKMSKKDSAGWVTKQNAARRAKYNTKG